MQGLPAAASGTAEALSSPLLRPTSVRRKVAKTSGQVTPFAAGTRQSFACQTVLVRGQVALPHVEVEQVARLRVERGRAELGRVGEVGLVGVEDGLLVLAEDAVHVVAPRAEREVVPDVRPSGDADGRAHCVVNDADAGRIGRSNAGRVCGSDAGRIEGS